ncbi:hypothetical protein C8R44DRAFT_886308 [Mycena epipterygia]|nr:hypothetical protein C8R44DRAFT_886308 [Mycena epipterygia]
MSVAVSLTKDLQRPQLYISRNKSERQQFPCPYLRDALFGARISCVRGSHKDAHRQDNARTFRVLTRRVPDIFWNAAPVMSAFQWHSARVRRHLSLNTLTHGDPRKPPLLFLPLSTTPAIFPTTSPKSGVRSLSSQSTSYPSSRLSSWLATRASNTRRLLGSELGGAIGGAVFLALVFIVLVCIRRRHARALEARMSQRQVPFVVNPTWVLASPTTLEGGHSQSHLSLPDRARPRTVPVVAHQLSMPNLATQYRTRVLRPRASTVGSATLARTETKESARARSEAVAVGPTRSESSVWRPRIDISSTRQTHTEGPGPGHPQSPMDSFWAE